MKSSRTLLGLGAFFLVTKVTAFPTAVFDMMERAQNSKTPEEIAAAIAAVKDRRQVPPPGFNAASQYISNQGAHQFVPPNFAAGDQRGPCPGLNALANHGYLPHNGVGTITQFIQSTNEVFGMGLDLAAFLSVYGAVVDGDTTSWSIGGPTPAVGLGIPRGMSGSHNKYETDASPTRPDLYQYGNDYKLVMSQWEEFFATQPDPATANYDLDVIIDFRAKRFQESIGMNSRFFNGPFTGLFVQTAAYSFIYRFMANKSAEYPEGILNQDVLKSFFAISGSPGQFTWSEGHEQIPNNWYTRSPSEPYDLAAFNLDILAGATRYPEFLSVGGNTGTTNSFTGIDPSDLTGGVYHASTLLQGNNAICLALQAAQLAAPDLLAGILAHVLVQLGLTSPGGILAGLACPQLSSIDDAQFAMFPGSGTS